MRGNLAAERVSRGDLGHVDDIYASLRLILLCRDLCLHVCVYV
jgi:hypothetical protein